MTAPAVERASRLRRVAATTEQSVVDLLLEAAARKGAAGCRPTLLAVCPISPTVVRAALDAAQEAHTPLLFAATLNQVDTDGGYTGWTPAAFAAFVRSEAEQRDIHVPLVLGLDHGGPWKKDVHAHEMWTYQATYDAVCTSLEACIDAGYELLHLDPTVDCRLPPGTLVPIPTIVSRTVQLMRHAEQYRTTHDREPLAYEVGTEEVGGGLQSTQRFQTYLRELRMALDRHGLPHPSFVVGDVGTTLDSSHFNTTRARTLTEQAQREIGAVLKGHYTDNVGDLAAYPLSGMGGANLGPGLSAAEYDALNDLVHLESQLDADSGLPEALRTAIVDSGRWKKWLHPEEEGLAFTALPDDRQRWLMRTGSRYVWSNASVREARERLYANVAPCRDADAFVQWRVRSEILRYMHAFHLVDLNTSVRDLLATEPAAPSP